MRIRLKLTLLLLCFALLPLLTVETLDTFGFSKLSGRVESQITEGITRRIEQELLVHVRRNAAQMAGIRDRVMTMTRTQAAVFREALEAPMPDAPPRVYRPGDLDALPTGEIPPGFREQPGWPRGTRPPPIVSYDRPLLTASPEGPAPTGGPDETARRLAPTLDVLSSLSLDIRDSIRAQFLGLEDGSHLSFPSKAGYRGYDPRKRGWYRGALREVPDELGGIVFTGPYRDAITGEPRLTASAAVRSREGELLGVTGVDFAISQTIELLELPAELALGSAAWVVLPEVDEDDDEAGASPGNAAARTPESRVLLTVREGQLATDPSAPADPRFEEIMDELAARRSGSMPIVFDGTPGLAAYGPIGASTGLVMFVPDHRIGSLIDGPRQDLRSIARESFRILLASLFLVVLLCLLGAYAIGRTVSRPIRRLADAAELVSEGDLTARVAIRHRGDEIGKLATAFNNMVPALADRMRLRDSIALANELQQGLLPKDAPTIEGFDVFGLAVYCDETGGDYFDYLGPIDLGPDRFGLAVGDVTGHGIPAALVMTSARALLQSHARYTDQPHDILVRMNETIARESTHGKFMTFALLVLDLAKGTLEVANAGHDPAILYKAESASFEELAMGGLPLGIAEDAGYTTARTDLPAKGDILVLGTDGIWETRDARGEMFGKARLRDLIGARANESAESIGRAILDALAEFRGSAPVHDDITFIVAKRVAPETGHTVIAQAEA